MTCYNNGHAFQISALPLQICIVKIMFQDKRRANELKSWTDKSLAYSSLVYKPNVQIGKQQFSKHCYK